MHAVKKRKGLKALSSSKGFTIIELLVVIVIIGVLAAISFIAYSGINNRAKYAANESTASQIGKQLALYNAENGDYPTSDEFEEQFSDDFGDNFNYSYEPLCGEYPCPGEGEYSPDGYNLIIGQDWPENCELDNSCPIENAVIIDSSDQTVSSMDPPKDCPDGFIPVPGSITYTQKGFCVMKYEAKTSDGSDVISSTEGDIINNVTQFEAINKSKSVEGCGDGCHLISESEWMTIAQNVAGVSKNWVGGTVGVNSMYVGVSNPSSNGDNTTLRADPTDADGYYDNADSNIIERRILYLSNGQVIWDFSGNYQEWTSGTTIGNQPGVIGEGYATRYWHQINNVGKILPNIFPSGLGVGVITDNNAATIRLGTITSSSGDLNLRAFSRGGNYSNGIVSFMNGVLCVDLSSGPMQTSTFVGFRAAK